MRPVLGEQPVRIMQRPEQRRVVGSQPAPEHRLMGARDDADRIELNAAERANHLQQPRLLHRRIAGRARSAVEPRGDHRQRSGFLEERVLAGHRAMPSGGESPSPCAQAGYPLSGGWGEGRSGLRVRANDSYRGERLRGLGHRHLDVGSEALQLVHEPLIAAVQVMQGGDDGLAGGDQPGQDHTGPGPDIKTTHGAPGQ